MAMTTEQIIRYAIQNKASDIHFTVHRAPSVRVNGDLFPIEDEPVLTMEDTYKILLELVGPDSTKVLIDTGDLDTAVNTCENRFRLNAYRQRGSIGIAMRVISYTTPTLDDLGMPAVFKDLTTRTRGLILVTGPTGSGKSTTLSAMIDHVNKTRHTHILTLEDPIEYLHKHKMSIINQREIGVDTYTFATGLRAAMREDPDIILVGEMRDPETISTALTAAETGHLVMSTLHTTGSAKTIDRIIDSFPPHQQQQVRSQVSTALQAVISQQLCPTADGKGRVAALEVMIATPAIRNLIREAKTPQVNNVISTSTKMGMCSMDGSLANLIRKGIITRQTGFFYSVEPDMLTAILSGNVLAMQSMNK